jgi:hypothetical protein
MSSPSYGSLPHLSEDLAVIVFIRRLHIVGNQRTAISAVTTLKTEEHTFSKYAILAT